MDIEIAACCYRNSLSVFSPNENVPMEEARSRHFIEILQFKIAAPPHTIGRAASPSALLTPMPLEVGGSSTASTKHNYGISFRKFEIPSRNLVCPHPADQGLATYHASGIKKGGTT